MRRARIPAHSTRSSQWSCSHHLHKNPDGSFEGTMKLPWGEKVTYKYIVDGRWTTTDDQATELDPAGNLNNILRVPARPEPAPAPAPAAVPETEAEIEATPEVTPTVGVVNGIVETAKQAAVSMVEALAPGTAETPAETPATEVRQPHLFSAIGLLTSTHSGSPR